MYYISPQFFFKILYNFLKLNVYFTYHALKKKFLDLPGTLWETHDLYHFVAFGSQVVFFLIEINIKTFDLFQVSSGNLRTLLTKEGPLQERWVLVIIF